MLRRLDCKDWLALTASALFLVLAIEALSLVGFQKQPPSAPQSATDQKAEDFPWYESSAIWTAIFTCLLTFSTIGLWTATRAALQLTRKEFVATHRPRLRLRRPRLHLDLLPVRVDFIVANVGETPAHMKRAEITICLRDSGGNEHIPSITSPTLRTIAAGESILDAVQSSEITYEEEFELWAGGRVEIRGVIDYTDDGGIERQTGFWRVYDPETKRFRRQEHSDPDYEYED
jgi:hypothetical protein